MLLVAAGKVKVYTLVQARLSSLRLPRKVLAPLIEGRTMLGEVVRRAEQIGPPVVVVIPGEEKELARYCLDREWTYLQGPTEDVLERFRLAATTLRADHVIRVTADCPFLDVEAARLTLETHVHGGYDFTHYIAEGRAVQVYSTAALLRAASKASERFRHSPDVWILSRPQAYHVHEVKFSVDTETDLATARRRAEEVSSWHQGT